MCDGERQLQTLKTLAGKERLRCWRCNCFEPQTCRPHMASADMLDRGQRTTFDRDENGRNISAVVNESRRNHGSERIGSHFGN